MRGSLDWLPSCAREHLTDRWFGTTSCIFSPSSSRCDNILFTPKFSSVSGMPFFQQCSSGVFSSAVPRFDWHFFLASWQGLEAHRRHLQGKQSPGNPAKNRLRRNLGMKFAHGSLEVQRVQCK